MDTVKVVTVAISFPPVKRNAAWPARVEALVKTLFETQDDGSRVFAVSVRDEMTALNLINEARHEITVDYEFREFVGKILDASNPADVVKPWETPDQGTAETDTLGSEASGKGLPNG